MSSSFVNSPQSFAKGRWAPPLLATERLVVRPLVETDATAVFTLAANPRVSAYTLWEPHRSPADSLEYIRAVAFKNYANEVPEPCAVALREDPATAIGLVGCFWVIRAYGSMEIAFSFAEAHWGHGYAAEAARAMLAHVFAHYAVERVQGRCMVENERSARVLAKLGFRHEGIHRHEIIRHGRPWDVSYHALLRHEWEAR